MTWVLLLLTAVAVTVLSCARLCLAAVRWAEANARVPADRDRTLTLYEAAFLSGGPRRVADLTLVSMARERRLLLAHTGWATVVDPHGRDELELSVLDAIGPRGQSRIAVVRATAAAADAVEELAGRLTRAGLAVADGTRTTVARAARQVWATVPLVVALGALGVLAPVPPGADGAAGTGRGVIAAFFALPLTVLLGSLLIARFEAHPDTPWASPAGRRLLAALPSQAGGERGDLAAVAVRGIRAIGDPRLRAAFSHRDAHPDPHEDPSGADR